MFAPIAAAKSTKEAIEKSSTEKKQPSAARTAPNPTRKKRNSPEESRRVRNKHTVKDPVCGKDLNEETAPCRTVINNGVYYFNSAACQAEFNRNLAKYLKEDNSEHHASHYGGYCGPTGCGKPARSTAWYFYLGLLFLIAFLLLVIR